MGLLGCRHGQSARPEIGPAGGTGFSHKLLFVIALKATNTALERLSLGVSNNRLVGASFYFVYWPVVDSSPSSYPQAGGFRHDTTPRPQDPAPGHLKCTVHLCETALAEYCWTANRSPDTTGVLRPHRNPHPLLPPPTTRWGLTRIAFHLRAADRRGYVEVRRRGEGRLARQEAIGHEAAEKRVDAGQRGGDDGAGKLYDCG
jgi:hypothetical protein